VRGDSTPPGADQFRYDVDAQWEKVPAGIAHRDVSAVGVDSSDRVYLLTRFDSNVLVYEPDGTFDALLQQGPVVTAEVAEQLPGAVQWVVDAQLDCGVDVINDGEYVKAAGGGSYSGYI
jgi:hypothetical protein